LAGKFETDSTYRTIHVHGVTVGVWLRAVEMEIGAAQWADVAWEVVYFFSCIECMRCRLLLLMFVVSVLSRGSTRLHCAKTAEQMKIVFGVNTVGGPRNIVLDRGLDPLQ